MESYDAILFVSFGGPEGMDDVMPFLQNVLHGKNVPPKRMKEVAHHYELFGGVSPINGQNRKLIAELERELRRHEISLPIYWGNRNWHPLLCDTLRGMKADGIKKALAFVTSAFSSYSGCRQYLEDIERAIQAAESTLSIDKIRAFFNHPGFIEANTCHLLESIQHVPHERRDKMAVLFSAHSIPLSMADNCNYVGQLEEASRLVAESAGVSKWSVVFQSRSGPPSQPWLGPDINEAITDLARRHVQDVVVLPIGFISDHMEVVYDLDTEAHATSLQAGVSMIRAQTVGTHPAFVSMIRELIEERLLGNQKRISGIMDAAPDVCSPDCCQKGMATSSSAVEHPASRR